MSAFNESNQSAIIGFTGFVGATLWKQHNFLHGFNTNNIETISGRCFDILVCAAAPGSMVVANMDPERDRASIDGLIALLGKVKARRFVLISSIAVLADFAAGDTEDTQAFQREFAYGLNRRALEEFCELHFDDCLVVRLPALYGLGLKKNFVFDLMNPVPTMLSEGRLQTLLDQLGPDLRAALAPLYAPDATTRMQKLDRAALNASPKRAALDVAVRAAGLSATEFHNPDTTYQYYDMARLWVDIRAALDAGLRHIHLAVAPLRVADIHARLVGFPMRDNDAKLHHEDMHTHHAALWGRTGPYLEDADEVLDKLKAFYEREMVAK